MTGRPIYGAERPDIEALKNHLLKFGGNAGTVFGGFQRADYLHEEVSPEVAAKLLEVSPVPGHLAHLHLLEHRNCHVNSAQYCKRHPGNKVMFGLALSDDGIWRAHSWVRRPDGTLVETTEARTLYVGTEDENPALV